MYKAIILDAYGTGAPEHRYATCRGVAFSKSPKRALALAQERANQQPGSEWTPIYREVKLFHNNKLIHEAY